MKYLAYYYFLFYIGRFVSYQFSETMALRLLNSTDTYSFSLVCISSLSPCSDDQTFLLFLCRSTLHRVIVDGRERFSVSLIISLFWTSLLEKSRGFCVSFPSLLRHIVSLSRSQSICFLSISGILYDILVLVWYQIDEQSNMVRSFYDYFVALYLHLSILISVMHLQSGMCLP